MVKKVIIPGAKSLKITFDPLCRMESDSYLQFFGDKKKKESLTERMYNNNN